MSKWGKKRSDVTGSFYPLVETDDYIKILVPTIKNGLTHQIRIKEEENDKKKYSINEKLENWQNNYKNFCNDS